MALAFLAQLIHAGVLISALLWSCAVVEAEHEWLFAYAFSGIVSLCSSEDKYCNHFRFIIHMSNTQTVRATADLREREELDEDNQV